MLAAHGNSRQVRGATKVIALVKTCPVLTRPCCPCRFRFGIDRIDLWSLDVEGAELEVLKTVDFSRLRVNAMVVEVGGAWPRIAILLYSWAG